MVQKQATVVDKVPELQSISSISANTSTPSTTPNEGTIIQCNVQWKNIKMDEKKQQQKNQKKINCFVKDYLFKKVKFYNLEMMCYKTQENSIY